MVRAIWPVCSTMMMMSGDNQVATEYDEHNNAVDFTELCDNNYERYLLWSIVLPTEAQ